MQAGSDFFFFWKTIFNRLLVQSDTAFRYVITSNFKIKAHAAGEEDKKIGPKCHKMVSNTVFHTIKVIFLQ